jgi:hypothetical protein
MVGTWLAQRRYSEQEEESTCVCVCVFGEGGARLFIALQPVSWGGGGRRYYIFLREDIHVGVGNERSSAIYCTAYMVGTVGMRKKELDSRDIPRCWNLRGGGTIASLCGSYLHPD